MTAAVMPRDLAERYADFTGYRRYAGIEAGAIEIDWVYNSMPPKPGPIYPVKTLTPIETF